MTHVSHFIRSFFRFLLLWIVDAAALLITAAIIPAITLAGSSEGQSLITEALAAALILSVINLLIRPLVLMIARPLGFIAVFLIGFVANALALMATAWLLPAFQVSGWLAAFVGGLIFASVNMFLTGIMEVDEQGSFYQGLIERLARRHSYAPFDLGKRGLVMLEIDGLSYHHIQKALDQGLMPTMARLIEEQGYRVSRVDCGIPSQTSACQAGIMFGDNHDIPAFRWYDKDQQKLYVSGKDASELNSRYANGNGLMRQGSSINNMLDGDAEKSLLTMAGLFEGDDEDKKRRAEDIYLLLLNPYFLMRTLALFFTDVFREIWQGWQQRRRGVEPRLNRLAHGYPFIRAATTVLMRDMAAHLAMLEVIRGAPSIYVTWPGYDEVAHHSGPWTADAFKVLASYDRVIERVWRAIQDKAPRPYDLIVLSDHGQSYGATFKQRYGVSLKEFIESKLPHGTTVAQSMGGDNGLTSLSAVSGELQNIHQAGVGGSTGRALIRRLKEFFDTHVHKREQVGGDPGEDESAHVTAYGSGNLAQVYFHIHPRKIKLSELDEAFPGVVDALVEHEGIGFVCGYEDSGTPVVLGKEGRRNLYTGEVEGRDPLLAYAPTDTEVPGHADIETRVWQVRRVMDFPHAGDLMVISTLYEDGTVAALEELIGNHGGLGGEQTDAFLFHPGDMTVTATRNAIDVFGILNARRDQRVPAQTIEDQVEMAPEPDAWSLSNLWAGLQDLRTWVSLALRALTLDRSAYEQIVADKRMTGPALMLGLLITGLSSIGHSTPAFGPVWTFIVFLLGWLMSVLAVFIAGRALTGRGNFTRTLRGLGFAQVVHIVELLNFYPRAAAFAAVITPVLNFMAIWMAAAAAAKSSGWRSVVKPLLAIVIMFLLPIVFILMISGLSVSVQSVLGQLGLVSGTP